jgi:hypothetical protein
VSREEERRRAPATAERVVAMVAHCPPSVAGCGIARYCCSASPARFADASWPRDRTVLNG